MKRIFSIMLCLLLLSSCSGLPTPEPTADSGWTPIIKKNLGTEPIIKNLSASIGNLDFTVITSELSVRVEFTDLELDGMADVSKESGNYFAWDERVNHYLSMNDYALESIVDTSSKDKAVSLVVWGEDRILLTISDRKVLYDFTRAATKNANGPDITFEEFIQLYEGMFYEEVVTIVGSPGEWIDEGVYMWYGKDGLSSATITFQDDVLVLMEQVGLMPQGGSGGSGGGIGVLPGRPGGGGGFFVGGGGGVMVMPAAADESVTVVRIG